MPNAGLALLLALASTPAAPGQANELTLASARLEQRIAERGPIRLQLEAALGASAMEIAAHALDGTPTKTPKAATRKSDDAWVWIGVLLALVVLFIYQFSKSECCF